MRRLALGLTLIAALLASAPSSAKTTVCHGAISADGTRYHVAITKGSYDCAKAKRTMQSFLATAARQTGFVCTRNHGEGEYAASCAKGKTLIMRAYVIVSTAPGCGSISTRHCAPPVPPGMPTSPATSAPATS